jgi:ATP-dependent RNA helicase HelY
MTLTERAAGIGELWERLTAEEKRLGIPPTRPPEPGFAALAHRWAVGTELEDMFEGEDEPVGDFVRTTRQLIDLLRQVRDAVPALADQADRAARALDRGVVAAAGAV